MPFCEVAEDKETNSILPIVIIAGAVRYCVNCHPTDKVVFFTTGTNVQ
jgi:hypothetical protein